MKYDIIRKRHNDVLPNGFERYKYFSCSEKFTRLRNGSNKYKNRPKVEEIKKPNYGFYEIYGALLKELKKKYTIIPYID